ncbi:MAG: rod shape-determining protein [Cellulosilyticaceae bacterium]
MFFGGADIGIDLGTASVLIYIKGKGIILKEPSIVAINTKTGKVIAVGDEAYAMLGRTPASITSIRPLKRGVIDDYDATEKMLKYFIHKAIGNRLIKPRIAVCVPSGVTDVEQRAVEDATRQAGARSVAIIEEPVAAAIGAGIDISQAYGNMIVDIGGGTADIAVISLGGTVVKRSLAVAGDNFDDAIVRYVRKKYNLLIGERTAEDIKIKIGSAYPRKETVNMDVKGRDLVSGLPKNVEMSSDEIFGALIECSEAIITAIYAVLETTPPELAADISERGILLTGGGSMIYGLDKLITERTGIKAVLAEDAISCVAIGTGLFVEYTYKKGGII